MHLFLTGVLPFLAHDHPSAVAFLTCRHHNFHASIIPEFLSDQERVKSFCEARQQRSFFANAQEDHRRWFNVFVHTPLMQFSPSLALRQKDCAESILKPLLETKYFTRSLQRCTVGDGVPLTVDLLQGLSKVQSLTELNLGRSNLENTHLEIIVNSFPSLETLGIPSDEDLLDSTTAIKISSPPPSAAKTLKSLTMRNADPLFATQFVPNFSNLRKLELMSKKLSQGLDVRPLSSSLPLLTELSLFSYSLDNLNSLKNLVHLSTLRFILCPMADLSFLAQDGDLPQLTTLIIGACPTSTFSSFASLSHASNLHVLALTSGEFNNDCLQYLENMVHLRRLILSTTGIVGDSRLLKTLTQNVFQLEDLCLGHCQIGNQGAIAGALYSTHSRLRVLDMRCCKLVDDDLNGIGALKNVLEDLDLSYNKELTNEGLVHCRDLVKLKRLKLEQCEGIDDISSLKGCLNLEEFHGCRGLTDDSFKVFSKVPTSFPNLRRINLRDCINMTAKCFKHLSKHKHLVYQLTELHWGSCPRKTVPLSASDQKNLVQLKGLRRLHGLFSGSESLSDRNKLKDELLRRLSNLDVIS